MLAYKIKKALIVLISSLLGIYASAQSVSNVKANFSCPGQVTVTYDLQTGKPTDVTLYYSPDGGKTWLIAQSVTGNLAGETSGTGKTIVWDSRADKVRWGNFKLKVEVPQPPEPECVMINGVCWATRNVGEPGKFVDNPEDAGMFYQWNRTQGWSATGTVTGWDSSTPTGTTWETANNVCPTGYRVPTDAEIQSLVDAGSQWTTQNGVTGRVFGSGDETLFLPAAGYRYGSNGTLNNAGSYGYYWSGTPNGTTGAYSLLFSSGNAYRNSHNRGNGFSVRCVAD